MDIHSYLLVAEPPALEPISVALKFGFVAVLYLFLLWVVTSVRGDLKLQETFSSDATAAHSATASLVPKRSSKGEPRLEIVTSNTEEAGLAYDLLDGAVLGRGDSVDIRIEDPFASTDHARVMPQGDLFVLEDLDSTNGTYLNGSPVKGVKALHSGDRIRIGENEFIYRND